MNILCIGDVVGRPGRDALIDELASLKKEFNVDLTIVNGENAAGGFGLTSRIAKQFFKAGVDVITLGDHVWDQKDLEEFLDRSDSIIRPANFPNGVPGRGHLIVETEKGIKVGVVNIIGRVFMRYQVDCPFRTLNGIVDEIKKETQLIVVDMHAETTSEKVAIGHFIDGKVSILFGTHTHIQTADEKILENGTAYISDLGMTGPYDSVIGQEKTRIINRFMTSMPTKFQVATDQIAICGIVVGVDEKTGKAKSIKRIQRQI